MTFSRGIKQGTPIALGYIPIGTTFGLLARSNGIPNHITILMSVLVFAGASQFITVNLIALGAGHLEIVTTTFLVNLRHLLMSASLAPKFEKDLSKKIKSLIGFGITDETFALASLKDTDNIKTEFILGVNFIAYSSWVGGTILGVFFGDLLPTVLQNSLGIALYAMFIGLLVPKLKQSRSFLIVSGIAMGANGFLQWSPTFDFLNDSWAIMISTIFAAGAGVVLFSNRKEKRK